MSNSINIGRVAGSMWYSGNAGDSNSINEELMAGSITSRLYDLYLNVDTESDEYLNVYQLIMSGDEMKWVRMCNLRGAKGDVGDTGWLHFNGIVNTVEDLPGKAIIGELYLVGNTMPRSMYVYTEKGWIDNGPLQYGSVVKINDEVVESVEMNNYAKKNATESMLFAGGIDGKMIKTWYYSHDGVVKFKKVVIDFGTNNINGMVDVNVLRGYFYVDQSMMVSKRIVIGSNGGNNITNQDSYYTFVPPTANSIRISDFYKLPNGNIAIDIVDPINTVNYLNICMVVMTDVDMLHGINIAVTIDNENGRELPKPGYPWAVSGLSSELMLTEYTGNKANNEDVNVPEYSIMDVNGENNITRNDNTESDKEREIKYINSWFATYDRICIEHLRCQRLGIECEHDISNLDNLAEKYKERLNELCLQ